MRRNGQAGIPGGAMALPAAAVAALLSLGAPAAGADPRTFPVARFGAVGDGRTDDRAAIQRAIDAAVEAGPGTTVAFEPGRVYRLARHAPGFGVLMLSGAAGVTLAGNGATLLAHPSNRILAIYACRQVVVRGFYLDYDPLPFTQGRMTAVDPEGGTVAFTPDHGYQDPVPGDEGLYRDFKTSDCVFIAASGTFTHSWLRLREVSGPVGGRFVARFHGSPEHVSRQLGRTGIGDFIAVKLLFPEGDVQRAPDGRFMATGVANINMAFCHDVRLSDIVSYAAPGMTFNAHGSEAIVLERCAVIRKPGTTRLIAGQSDGCHLKSLTIMPRISDCRFEALMDDSINVKISSQKVGQTVGRRVLVAHGDILYNDVVVKPGDELEMYDPEERAHLGFGRVAAVERVDYRRAWLTFEEEPPGLEPGDLLYHRPVTPVEIRGVTFGTQLKTAIIIRPPGTVADCVFDGVAYGVHAFVNDAIEGCMPREIRVRSCTFQQNSIAALALAAPSLRAAPPSPFTLEATGCRFVLAGGMGRLLSAYNVRGVALRECVAEIADGRTLAEVILVRGCAEVDTAGVELRAAQD